MSQAKPRPGEDSITFRLRVAQQLIGKSLVDLRELASVLGLLATDAHERGVVSEETFQVVQPALSELDTLLTRALELFMPGE